MVSVCKFVVTFWNYLPRSNRQTENSFKKVSFDILSQSTSAY